MPLTNPTLVDRLEALLVTATPEPWSVEKFSLVVNHERRQRISDVSGHSAEERAENAKLIAALRNAAPAIILALRAAQSLVDTLENFKNANGISFPSIISEAVALRKALEGLK